MKASVCNKSVAQALEEIVKLLELTGENPFKIRSYAAAARLIGHLSEPVAALIEEGRLRELEGIGEALEKKIIELVTTGRLAYLEDLRQQFPEGILDLFRVQGLAAKSIRALYDGLGVASLESLRTACLQGETASLKGFSKDRERKILASLQFLDEQQDRFRIDTAWVAAEVCRRHLLEKGDVFAIDVAGSLRRFKEIVKDIDLLAVSDEPEKVMAQFIGMPGVQRVVSAGETKAAIVSEGGIPVDLRVVSRQQYPYALLHFTGSKEHNVVLRRRAGERGLKLNEYGLFREDGTLVSCHDEAAVYAALNLPWLPPELREGLFEFTLPAPIRLVEQSDVVGMIHCHSKWSDGANTIEEIARATRERGYAYLVLTDHSRSSVYVNGLSVERVLAQHDEIDALNAHFEDFRIIKGIESDIHGDGSLDYPGEVLERFEFVIASIHSGFDMTETEATQRIIRAMENPHTSVIGHLTGRLLLSRPGYPVMVEKVVDAAVANGVAIEINANPQRLDMDWRHVRRAAEKGVRFMIGPDAHRIAGLGNMRYGLGIARKGALAPEQVLNCLPVKEIIRWRARR